MTLPLLLALLMAAPDAASAEEGVVEPPTLIGDAQLNDVAFVDDKRGWAVGDRGAIWRTDDGGQHWQWQDSGVSQRLSAVCFLNAERGWAAGGFAIPYTHSSAGIVLFTRDGGDTWTRVPKLLLPSLRRLRFFDERHGWTIGCSSAMCPSGVFTTDDGGRSWTPLLGGNEGGWLAGDFLRSYAGALAGQNGISAIARDGEIVPLQAGAFDVRSRRQLRLVDARHGWLVGDGGLVMTTADRGATWQPPPAELPAAAHWFDFEALAARGPRCWIAGTPGTRIFHTSDAGQTWSAVATGSRAPIRAITFVDETHGWAVGDLGTILATSDGGQSWQRQRSGGARAAILGLFADGDDAPLELFLRFSDNEGYLAAAEILGRRDIELRPRGDAPLADRFHEAIVRAGGSSAGMAWQFPLRQAGLRLGVQKIVDAWDRIHDGRGREALLAHLVLQIRLWRPEIVVTSGAGRDDEALDSLIEQAVLEAVRQAADVEAFPGQRAEAGLDPWQVKVVYAALPPGTHGTVELSAAQPAVRWGRTLADAAAELRGLLLEQPSPTPPDVAFRRLAGEISAGQDRRDFCGGIALPPGSDARRQPASIPKQGIAALEHTAQRRKHIQAILEQSARLGQSAEQLLARTNELTRELDGDSAGRIFHQLADRYRHTGRWSLAAETFQTFVERFPNHSLTPGALLWLVQFHASEEAAWRMGVDQSEREQRYERALALGTHLEQSQPGWFGEPSLRFPQAAACRNLDRPQQAERYYSLQGRGDEHDAWWACAQSELRLISPNSQSLKPTLACVRAESRPRLDGRLDDSVWQQAKPASLQSSQHDDAEWPAEVMLAYDAEYLYVAARCRRSPESGPIAPPPPGPRPRDSDLSSHDRVEFMIDLDRDYATFYRLAVDERGWTNDSWWADDTWNPKWYVAVAATDDAWTFEAAIPLDQLTGRPPKTRDVWAMGVQRVAPGVGFQSWSSPAGVVARPEGFGHLTFD